jgi:hypothetical protein
LAKVAIALIGLLVLDSVHLGGLFILFLDYLGVTTWYLWLTKYEIQGRVTIKRVSCYFFVIALLLLITAILGAIWKSWIIALEVFPSNYSRDFAENANLARSNWSSFSSRHHSRN